MRVNRNIHNLNGKKWFYSETASVIKKFGFFKLNFVFQSVNLIKYHYRFFEIIAWKPQQM